MVHAGSLRRKDLRKPKGAPQIPPLRIPRAKQLLPRAGASLLRSCGAPVGMTKGRAVLPGTVVAEQESHKRRPLNLRSLHYAALPSG
jgi:hypothetical protein